MNAPTLIVGLGGKGSDIALRVANMCNDEQRKSISFAVFDTDINELREIQKGNPFIHTIQTSTRLSVGEYLDIDTHARDTWFPVNSILNSKALSEGAGQVRAVSRLAFETAVRAGKMEALHKAIDDLYKLEGSGHEQTLRVVIVSSLAGGTGSGLILPVASYIKHYLKAHYSQNSNITRGFFLLPEIFYHVIKGETERNNLKCNAYATLRELDAFLMKGDNTLDEKYLDSVNIEFPNVSSGTYETYSERPYDFCFLFDAQNADGGKLDSFDAYLEHAARCIYAQSIGPMNKRSNSSEDNVIRKLASEKGRNRYAGAGTSMLIYPNELIKEYIALNWTKECISEDWLIYDNLYESQMERIKTMKRDGKRAKEPVRSEEYIRNVDTKASEKHGFSKAVQDSCTIFSEDGLEERSYLWNTYLDTLADNLTRKYSEGNPTLDGSRTSAETNLRNLSDEETIAKGKDAWEDYATTYYGLVNYRKTVQKYVKDLAGSVAYTIFRTMGEDVTKDESPYRMEACMKNENGEFLHPNAARYFLYNLASEMEKYHKQVTIELDECDEFFANFEQNYFDDPKTEDIIEDVDALATTKKIKLSDKIRKRLSTDQENLIQGYKQYLANIDEIRVKLIIAEVLEEGLKYVNNLTQAFEQFYIYFGTKLEKINERIAEIEINSDIAGGSATRNVCFSRTCLKKFLENARYTGSLISIDSELASSIYMGIHNYATNSDKIVETDYFGEIFDNNILQYFKTQLVTQYNLLVDMDIFDAIGKEAEYEQNIREADRRDQYVIKVLDEAKKLAVPFIEKPTGEEKDPINSCAYNTHLIPTEQSRKERLLKSELKDFGGEKDDDIPMNTVIFYKSFYGLRATDLGKFAPPHFSPTEERGAGEYFKAYYELVGEINPRSEKSRVITPHIDKMWHNVSKMPDLDDENQYKQENAIYAALFWSILGSYISLSDVGEEEKLYTINIDSLDMTSKETTFVVSNGTPCDRLYEVLDAISIYPEYVTKINKKIATIIKEARDDNENIYDVRVFKWIKDFRIDGFPLPENGVRSIFELPLLIKRSTPIDLYNEADIINILEAEMDEIIKTIKALADSSKANRIIETLIEEQFDLLVENIKKDKVYGSFFHSALFNRFTAIITKKLENLGSKKAVGRIEEKAIECKRG